MNRRLILTATLAAAFTLTLGPGARAARPPADVPVVATLADSGMDSVPLRVRSDGKGAYPTAPQSVIQQRPTGTDWLLTTYSTKRGALTWTRGAIIDLSEQETPGFATPLDGPTLVPVHLKAGCSSANVDMLRLTANQTVNCPGSFRFLAPNGHWYRLGFNQDTYSWVDPIAVTCNSVDASGCKTWTLRPSGQPRFSDPNPKNKAQLLEIDDNGFVLALGGTYFVSFSITLVR